MSVKLNCFKKARLLTKAAKADSKVRDWDIAASAVGDCFASIGGVAVAEDRN